MAQIELVELTNEWKAFSDIVTPADNTDYYIQNRFGTMLACEGASEPTTEEGVILKPYKTLKYKKGTQNLYLKAIGNKCTINVSSGA